MSSGSSFVKIIADGWVYYCGDLVAGVIVESARVLEMVVDEGLAESDLKIDKKLTLILYFDGIVCRGDTLIDALMR